MSAGYIRHKWKDHVGMQRVSHRLTCIRVVSETVQHVLSRGTQA